MVEMLENMEACALDLLMGIVAGIAKVAVQLISQIYCFLEFQNGSVVD